VVLRFTRKTTVCEVACSNPRSNKDLKFAYFCCYLVYLIIIQLVTNYKGIKKHFDFLVDTDIIMH